MIRYLLFTKKGSARKGTGIYPMPGKNYLLLFLTKPTKEETDKVASDFGLDKKPLLTFPKDVHSHIYLSTPSQFAVRSAYLEQGKLSFANILFSVTPNCAIFATSRDSTHYDAILDSLFEELKKKPVHNTLTLFCRFMREDIDENYEVLNVTEERVKDLELKAAQLQRTVHVQSDDIIYMKTILFKLSTQFWAMVRILSLIRIGATKVTSDPESNHLLGDLQETLRHQAELAIDLEEMLSDTLNIYSTGMAIRVIEKSHGAHVTLKRLTAYAIIVFSADIIVGKFTMNVQEPYFVTEPWGFVATVSAVATLMALTFVFAKRQRWL